MFDQKFTLSQLLLGDNPLQRHISSRWNVKMVLALIQPKVCYWSKPVIRLYTLTCDGLVITLKGVYGELLREDRGSPIVAYAGTTTQLHVLWMELYMVFRDLHIVAA